MNSTIDTKLTYQFEIAMKLVLTKKVAQEIDEIAMKLVFTKKLRRKLITTSTLKRTLELRKFLLTF